MQYSFRPKIFKIKEYFVPKYKNFSTLLPSIFILVISQLYAENCVLQ